MTDGREKKSILEHDPRRIMLFLLVGVILFAGNICRQAYSQKKSSPQAQKKEQKDEYHRPEPTHTMKPQIPGTSRNKPDKVFLENADSMVKTAGEVDRQVVIGNVKFRQMGMWMYCDSAYYFPELNSMDAFGNVRMEQGDTLFVYSDKLFYDGTTRYAKLRCGPTERQVRMINNQVTLTTDSLDYDLAEELGWYAHGGKLQDEKNTLTSIYGEYSPATKDATFYYDVVLHGEENDFNMYTDTLYYNTNTHIARIETPTTIITKEDEILTSDGFYNTETGVAEMLSRSTVIHTDSLNRSTFLEGDSILYDPATRISRAYSFRDDSKRPGPVVITDTARKAVLIGGFGIYNDSTKEAMTTEYPLMMEYSKGDTLFLRADTIRSWILNRFQPAEELPEEVKESLAEQVKELEMPEMPLPPAGAPIIPDSIPGFELDSIPGLQLDSISGFELDSIPGLQLDSISGFELDSIPKILPDSIQSFQIDSIPDLPDIIPDSIALPEVADLPDIIPDSIALPEVAELPLPEELQQPEEPQDSTYHYFKAYPRARFFRSDMQGVADTIIYSELDSIMRLIRLPIVWSEERQVRGDSIFIHMQDSTADWARIPSKAMMMEHVEEDFYNQLHSDKMMMYFENGGLRHLDAEGSVQTIMLPQEQDSTYNRLVDAESSYMSIDMLEGNKLDRLKMWPEVTGNVTPLFMVKKSQKLLPKAVWYDALRPRREWYGGKAHWADDLGEIPEELELYFENN